MPRQAGRAYYPEMPSAGKDLWEAAEEAEGKTQIRNSVRTGIE